MTGLYLGFFHLKSYIISIFSPVFKTDFFFFSHQSTNWSTSCWSCIINNECYRKHDDYNNNNSCNLILCEVWHVHMQPPPLPSRLHSLCPPTLPPLPPSPLSHSFLFLLKAKILPKVRCSPFFFFSRTWDDSAMIISFEWSAHSLYCFGLFLPFFQKHQVCYLYYV